MNTDINQLLVDPDWLHARLDDPGIRILDCTTWMTPQPVGPSRIDSGRPDWTRGHIPGARHVCMVEDLSDPAGRYPYTLPTPARIAALLSRLGIGNAHRVVLYSASAAMVTTRAWWVLSALGHRKVSVLDGGWARWLRESRPVSTTDVAIPAAVFEATAQPGWFADADQVASAMTSGSACLVNALSTEQFAGTGGAHYGRPGRIPGSVNVPARDLVEADGATWKSRDALARRFREAGLDDRAQPVIAYCGGGIAASAVVFALRRLGHGPVALYDNSLLEWSTDPDRPMAV